jgi:tetratricopeptide (TPR) repeat protein
MDLIDEKNPVFQRATRKAQEQDYEAAIVLYREALRGSPRSAKAHLQLGMIYDDVYKDPIRAVYHYERYLEMRPDAEKRDLVKDWAQRLRRDLAAEGVGSVPGRTVEVAQLQQEMRHLHREIEQLRHDNDLLRRELQARDEMPLPGVGRPGEIGPEIPGEGPAAPPGAARTYVVVPGDTLWDIARRHGTTVEALREANGVGESALLRPGQALKIPPTS